MHSIWLYWIVAWRMLVLLEVLSLGLMGILGGALIGLCNLIWSGLISVVRVSYLNRIASDHSHLLLSCDKNTAREPFRFKFLHA